MEFEDLFLKRISDAQEIKLLAIQGQTPLESFKQAVLNVYQLFSPTMPNPEHGAYDESEKVWASIQNELDTRLAGIKRNALNYDPDTRAYKQGNEEHRAHFESVDEFLAFLVAMGHKYNLFPRAGRVEPPGGSAYRGITE